MTLRELMDAYQSMSRDIGPGETFNQSELARAGRQSAVPPSIAGDDLVAFNRLAQSADVPATALLAAPYEALKGVEQATGVPVLRYAGQAANAVGIPVALPDETTSRASLKNVLASLYGASAGVVPREGTIGALLASIISGR